ncbi:MAG: 3'-5' exonuclease, partial [Oscillospiraceae bacterium]
ARYADHYHTLGYRGLGAFLRILDRLADRGEDLAPARLGERDNAVTISSIHRAKGLEWPVVLLCDTARTHSFYQNDLIAPTLLHAELGFACVRRDPALKKQYPTVPLAAVRLESERALLAEELRVLYVAMTRAREKLIVTASIKKAEAKLGALPDRTPDGRLPAARVLDCRSYAQWLLAAFSQREDFEALRRNEKTADGLTLVLANDARPAAPKTDGQTPERQAERADPALLGTLRARIGFAYPFARAALTPAKLPVSQLTHGERRLFEARPAFLRDGALTGAERGSAVHAFMQFCVYRNAREDPAAERERLRAGGWLTQKQADAVDLGQIADFFASDLARRIFSAERVLREFKFMAPASVSPMAADYVAGEGEATMLQGIADCILIEDGSATVLDYKTDRVGDGQTLADRYAPQLLLYRDMLGTALDVPVRECVLWSFALGREIRVFPAQNENNR